MIRNLKKILLVAPFLFVLAGCVATAPEPAPTSDVEVDLPKFTSSAFLGVFESLSTVENTEKPEENVVYYWNSGSKKFEKTGRFSLVYLKFDVMGSTLCYEDSEHRGAFTQATKNGDYSIYYAVSLEGDCADFTEDLSFRADLDGNGPYDLKIVDTTEDKTASDYVEGLQTYLDTHAAETAE